MRTSTSLIVLLTVVLLASTALARSVRDAKRSSAMRAWTLFNKKLHNRIAFVDHNDTNKHYVKPEVAVRSKKAQRRIGYMLARENLYGALLAVRVAQIKYELKQKDTKVAKNKTPTKTVSKSTIYRRAHREISIEALNGFTSFTKVFKGRTPARIRHYLDTNLLTTRPDVVKRVDKNAKIRERRGPEQENDIKAWFGERLLKGGKAAAEAATAIQLLDGALHQYPFEK